ncbi:PfkB family carbohydrate kinase [Peribacillus huizhouensis]|uniref:Fructokinase n=1 Tax=Peribacillus huizhouensis TaxID=1501239 RepID=A0ABR6CNI1_9BACI|nr:PfkB family carbohydrate kinase [Peribacillus huizhouensis]MBA9026575.1 fructokinase [Peribacillus huizhouensis]
MGSLYSIGEVLIDFIPLQKGLALKDVVSFERAPGGAPANVAATVAKLGGVAHMISKVGEDAFGDFLRNQLEEAGVKTDKLLTTKEAHTALAFVSLREDGERDFSFYRNPSADLLFSENEIEEDWFSEGDILHFCSVDLVESPMKNAHKKAIKQAQIKGSLISFDPNVRLPLWDRPEACREAILEFIPKADIIKISDEELLFITGFEDEKAAISSLFTGRVKVVIYTKGAMGATLYGRDFSYTSKGYSVKVQDTTGAGDAFIGAFLHLLLENGIDPSQLEEFSRKHHEKLLTYSNACGALTTMGKGAIGSLPTKEQIIKLVTKGRIRD